jgi:hypothetical protein
MKAYTIAHPRRREEGNRVADGGDGIWQDGKHEEPSIPGTADTVLTWVTGKGPLDEEVRALRDEVARVVCTNSGQLKMLRAELLAVEEERSAEAALHDRELTQLERQLAVCPLLNKCGKSALYFLLLQRVLF